MATPRGEGRAELRNYAGAIPPGAAGRGGAGREAQLRSRGGDRGRDRGGSPPVPPRRNRDPGRAGGGRAACPQRHLAATAGTAPAGTSGTEPGRARGAAPEEGDPRGANRGETSLREDPGGRGSGGRGILGGDPRGRGSHGEWIFGG